jgi:hypothetical protein
MRPNNFFFFFESKKISSWWHELTMGWKSRSTRVLIFREVRKMESWILSMHLVFEIWNYQSWNQHVFLWRT